MYTIKETQTHYIIYKDNEVYCKISKNNNNIEDIKKHFNIKA